MEEGDGDPVDGDGRDVRDGDGIALESETERVGSGGEGGRGVREDGMVGKGEDVIEEEMEHLFLPRHGEEYTAGRKQHLHCVPYLPDPIHHQTTIIERGKEESVHERERGKEP